MYAHQGQLNLGGEGLVVVRGLDEDDDGCGHSFGQLVRSDGVVLQRQVGEGDEAAKAQGQPHDPSDRQPLRREHVHLVADVESEPRGHEVDQGQRHVGETVVHVDPFVDEDDADGGEEVDQQPRDDAAVGGEIEHLLRRPCPGGVQKNLCFSFVYTAESVHGEKIIET